MSLEELDACVRGTTSNFSNTTVRTVRHDRAMTKAMTTYRSGVGAQDARTLMDNADHQSASATSDALPGGVILRPPATGRSYPCGPMQAVFLADGQETGNRYSVSIWWVEPRQPGPGRHAHADNEELFYVIEGTMTFLVGDRHVDAATGTFLRIPASVTHDFENRTARRAGVLNVFIPGGFEARMPAIVDWYRTCAHR